MSFNSVFRALLTCNFESAKLTHWHKMQVPALLTMLCLQHDCLPCLCRHINVMHYAVTVTSLCLSSNFFPSNCSETTATVKLEPHLQKHKAFYSYALCFTSAEHSHSKQQDHLTRQSHPPLSAAATQCVTVSGRVRLQPEVPCKLSHHIFGFQSCSQSALNVLRRYHHL